MENAPDNERRQSVRVAVLLATYNGGMFVSQQLQSLKENTRSFTLHWLDDHSGDNTREVVRSEVRRSDIELREWQQPWHLGIPGAFFQLLECVEADIYLFCDQDDSWQPGKIDATVEHLLPRLTTPALCFSDPLMIVYGRDGFSIRASAVVADMRPPKALDESRMFMSFPSFGNTQGFTRALRDIFIRHSQIARGYAHMHDCWMYLLAVACGSAHLMTDAPTTRHLRHGRNFTDHTHISNKGGAVARRWRLEQKIFRSSLARQARGFILAAPTLPQGPKLERILSIAALVSTIDRRQSPRELCRLVLCRAIWPSAVSSLTFAAACLLSNAETSSGVCGTAAEVK